MGGWVGGCGFGLCIELFSFSYGVLLLHSTSPIGVLSVRLFVLFFEGKANLKNTGAITLPSLDDIERAPADLKERLTECLQNTTSIELGHEDIILKNAWKNRVKDLPLKSPQEALILASIVEKETGLSNERRQVASVFINRLNRGIRLQTDPTVIYGITKGEKTLGRGLRRSELDRKTPWNTYRINGLPPTPIANPGRASIEAVLDPDDTNFIFFVADGTGGHSFAKTLKEHNANVRKWREIEAGKAQK